MDTVAIRSPVTMPGRASGSSIRHSMAARPYPMPRAASSTSAGTWLNPVKALRTIASSA